MASGRDASDWTVEHAGDEGAIWCHEYRGRFRVRNAGVVHIIWRAAAQAQPRMARLDAPPTRLSTRRSGRRADLSRN
jgi:hypothetical protein